VSFNGRTLASQANNVGSIPITRSTGSFQISSSSLITLAATAAIQGRLCWPLAEQEKNQKPLRANDQPRWDEFRLSLASKSRVFVSFYGDS